MSNKTLNKSQPTTVQPGTTTPNSRRKPTPAKLGWKAAKVLIIAAAAVTVASTLFLIAYILIQGIPHLNLRLFEWNYNTENASLMPALINTLTMTFGALLFAVPFGVGSAIYLTQYARKKSKLVKVVEIAAETLTGIPSIVYGLFGMLLFVTQMHLGYSWLAGVLTLGIMILPLILRTAQEALLQVEPTYIEASFGLGAGKLRTIFRVLLPAASPGIMAGVILGVGRVVGETAALIFTAGTVAQVATNFSQSARTLSVHMYQLSSEGLFINQSYATAVVLLVFVILINAGARLVELGIKRKQGAK